MIDYQPTALDEICARGDCDIPVVHSHTNATKLTMKMNKQSWQAVYTFTWLIVMGVLTWKHEWLALICWVIGVILGARLIKLKEDATRNNQTQ